MGGGFDREVGESYTRPSCSPARAATEVSKTPDERTAITEECVENRTTDLTQTMRWCKLLACA